MKTENVETPTTALQVALARAQYADALARDGVPRNAAEREAASLAPRAVLAAAARIREARHG